MVSKELKIAIEGIRFAVISLAVGILLSIIPLILSIFDPKFKLLMTFIVIIFYLTLAVWLIIIATKIGKKNSKK
ncbi:hypothetical protein HY212_05235 [Candidatus Pacearchaeota archaeon]|nr:hypothetical protein [Candidatus Pacearchaeota archaeon]